MIWPIYVFIYISAALICLLIGSSVFSPSSPASRFTPWGALAFAVAAGFVDAREAVFVGGGGAGVFAAVGAGLVFTRCP